MSLEQNQVMLGHLKKNVKQAGAELCQVEEKLGLAKPALPIKKVWLSSI